MLFYSYLLERLSGWTVTRAWRPTHFRLQSRIIQTPQRLFNYPMIWSSYQIAGGLGTILFIDALLIDDEPIFEPIEWSLWQTWLLFIFGFAWAGENLITARFGAYTGRDRRVWYSWYKSFWLVDGFYVICFGAAALFVIIPFYYELTYRAAFIYQWWHSYTITFFWTQALFSFVILTLLLLAQLGLEFLSWQRLFALYALVFVILAYWSFWQWFVSLWAFFTDANWYATVRAADLIQLSHEPARWGWGLSSRDHFTYHHSPTVFWYRNDGAFAGAMLLFTLMQAWTLFFILLFFIILLRTIWATREVSYTYSTYALSAIRHYIYAFIGFFVLILFSVWAAYWTFPLEFIFFMHKNDTLSLGEHVMLLLCIYAFR